MNDVGRKCLAATLIAVTLHICAMEGNQCTAAELPVGDKIVVTAEVAAAIRVSGRAARERRRLGPPTRHRHYHGGGGSGWGWGKLLVEISEFPILTVNVEPIEPPDFVISINGTPYQAGARMFRVQEGPATITVKRRGKDPCNATLEVSATEPNLVTCRL
jgi:hypothetical protein